VTVRPPGLTVSSAVNLRVAPVAVTVTCALCPSASTPSAGEMTSPPVPPVWEMLQVTGPFSAVSMIAPLGSDLLRSSMPVDTTRVPGVLVGVWVAVGVADGGGGTAGVPVDAVGAGVVGCPADGLVVAVCFADGCADGRLAAGAPDAVVLTEGCGVGVPWATGAAGAAAGPVAAGAGGAGCAAALPAGFEPAAGAGSQLPVSARVTTKAKIAIAAPPSTAAFARGDQYHLLFGTGNGFGKSPRPNPLTRLRRSASQASASSSSVVAIHST
jgi:hypothetical protein